MYVYNIPLCFPVLRFTWGE